MIEGVSFFLRPVLDEVQIILGHVRVQHNYSLRGGERHVAAIHDNKTGSSRNQSPYLIINDLYDMARAPLLVISQWPAFDSHLQIPMPGQMITITPSKRQWRW
jgi:hypothetical protein